VRLGDRRHYHGDRCDRDRRRRRGGIPQWFFPLLLVVPVLVFINRAMTMARQRLYGVRISENQFPEAYEIVRECAAAAGLKQVPEAYVVLGNGVLNAYASGHGFRRFIAVHSDLFEVGGRLKDPDLLRFIVGHEIGHIAAGHVSFLRGVVSTAANLIPFLGDALTRSQEYTADNYGYAIAPEGVRGMTVFAAGKYLYREVDFDAIADRGATVGGIFGFLVNLTTDHPVLTLRMAALRDRSKPGRLFF
jgi:Zn-dependent protease with chaperone function